MKGPKHRDFYIVNGGAELKWIITDPPTTDVIASNSGTMTKTIARACSSNLPSRTSSHIWQSAVTLHRVAAFCFTCNAYGSWNSPACSCVSIAIYHTLPGMSFLVGETRRTRSIHNLLLISYHALKSFCTRKRLRKISI